MSGALLLVVSIYLLDYGTPEPTVVWDHHDQLEQADVWGITTCWKRKQIPTCKITLNSRFKEYPLEHVRLTLLHELAHVVVYHEEGTVAPHHGRPWRRVMRRWGLSGRTAHPLPPY